MNYTSALIYMFEEDRRDIAMEVNIKKNSIIRGYFISMVETYGSFSAYIEIKNEFLLNNSYMKFNDEIHFSFSSKDKPSDFIPRIEFTYETSEDTFDKINAKNVSIDPAIKTLSKLRNQLHDVAKETKTVKKCLNEYSINFENFVVVSIYISLLAFLCSSFVYAIRIKNFFKRKKFI
ncbi:hypothetical protein CWI38_0791p0030 [Hamiltosporidium tvaerminnensis]|uniref:GOLD domain-containing protein n=1 Tax=Hamiltosporidium tvaerminnensis TaxID=1176355 RepID=A0A4Q9LX91_9MICR|nr:hypothetical protein CWI38_0791p0030 [Hamiltosporidium tvaerminnensis]